MKNKLCEIANIRSGHPFRGTIRPISKAETHVVQVRDVNEFGEINIKKLITTELIGRKDPDWLQTQDILFIAKGARHFASFVQQLPEQTVCSPYFFIIRINTEQKNTVLPEFIYWQLNQPSVQKYFKISAEGSLHVSIRRKILEDTPIALPPIAIQQKIVALHRAAIKEQKVLQQLINNRRQQLDLIANDLFCD